MLRILHSKSVRCTCGNVHLFTSKLNLDINVDTDMFNRAIEVNRMTELLSSSPKLTVLTGPVNSGKSRLIEYVIDKLRKDSPRDEPLPTHTVNLRLGMYNSVQSLVDSLSSDDITSWVNDIRKLVAEVGISVLRFQLRQDNRTPLDRLDILLKTIAGELPPTDFFH